MKNYWKVDRRGTDAQAHRYYYGWEREMGKNRGFLRLAGHQEGIKSVRDIVTCCREIGMSADYMPFQRKTGKGLSLS